MRILSMLAAKGGGSGGGGKKVKEDTFGMRDEDWDIYKAVSKASLISLQTLDGIPIMSMLLLSAIIRMVADLIVRPSKRS